MTRKFEVLVVEPSLVSRGRVQQELPHKLFNVRGVREIKEARSAIAELEPAVVFISTQCGEAQAFKFCTELARQGLAVIILDKVPTRDNVMEANRCGAVDLVLAPPPVGSTLPRVHAAMVRIGHVLPEPDSGTKLRMPETVRDIRCQI